MPLATAMAMAGLPHHYALKYKMSLATPLVTLVSVAANSNQPIPPSLTLQKPRANFVLFSPTQIC